MKLANLGGRAALVLGDEIADIADISGGRFGPEPMTVYGRWADFAPFAREVTSTTGPLVESELCCPVPVPRQVFAIGVNYRSHAEEAGMAVPDVPATFTKFPACLAGPFDASRSWGRRPTGRSSWWWSSDATQSTSTRRRGGRMWPG